MQKLLINIRENFRYLRDFYMQESHTVYYIFLPFKILSLSRGRRGRGGESDEIITNAVVLTIVLCIVPLTTLHLYNKKHLFQIVMLG
jgi:hypothetical protein